MCILSTLVSWVENVNRIKVFLAHESAPGVLLILSAVAAIICVNSPLEGFYAWLLNVPVEARIGALQIDKPLFLWINDGLMAVFFLLIGLEIKREMLEGHLSQLSQVVLPGLAAVGGMLFPALIYSLFNWGNVDAMKGWAIPAATDIAFALGVLSLLGRSVPTSLKVFLLTLAILDDLGAIIIIAIFYTAELSALSMLLAVVALVILALMNWSGVTKTAAYVVVGVFLWICVLKSGVHATLAGVALAFAIPLTGRKKENRSPLRNLEHSLHPWVSFAIIPIFAFANAGVPVLGLKIADITHPISLGIVFGLLIGKQLGIFLFSWVAIKLKIARLPEGASFVHLYGVAILCGIGFTMSLFIKSLAFENVSEHYVQLSRMSILLGSILSAVLGYIVLKRVGRQSKLPANHG